ncbi:MAG: cbb3-type cytochrome oxidase assembly protein CcoS [Bacteriovorax sp.]|jgi:cbb3-type cytochrome oxidase maturation protein|nr:cbb3-type cytochrome oxidase assembly protein CcoS [Bacteriovorax sp.]
MEVITILLPLALVLAVLFIAGFIWMTMKGQYDDLETPSMRMLIEENNLNINKDKSTVTTNKEGK